MEIRRVASVASGAAQLPKNLANFPGKNRLGAIGDANR
jgi:hypothetical protein